MSDDVETVLAEMEDYARALLSEHHKRVCEHQAPTVQSSYVARSLSEFAQRIRLAASEA